LTFHYSATPGKITILESLIGQSGWLCASNVTIASFETEDHLILHGCRYDGNELDEDTCRRFFSIPATPRRRQCSSKFS